MNIRRSIVYFGYLGDEGTDDEIVRLRLGFMESQLQWLSDLIVMSGQPLEARIIALVTEQMFALEFTSGPIKGSIVSYVLEAAEGGTRLTREFVLRLGGAWKLVYPLFRLREIRGREAGMANIKRLLESKARSPQPRPTQA